MLFLQGDVEEEKVLYLFYGAIAFLFPALYEGFGLLVLEAMACGTPTIVSTLVSFLEVGGQVVYYVAIARDFSKK